MHKRTAGFSLLQLSAIAVAAGLIAAALLPAHQGADTNSKYLLTKKRMEKIEEATNKMMATWGRRPCPASGNYQPGDTAFGTEDASERGDCVAGRTSTDGILQFNSSNVIAGTVPVKKLHLPSQYAFDAWGRPFTYVVDKRATEKGSCVADDFTQGDVTVTDSGTSNSVMSALISHGPDGYGAFLPQGSSAADRFTSGSNDADQIKNAGGSIAASSYTNNFVKKEKTSSFDDYVWYSERYKNTCCLGKICKELPYIGTTNTHTIIEGEFANAELGYSLGSGNFNGGDNDLIIGGNPNNALASKRLYVIFSGIKLSDPFTLSSLNGSNGFKIITAQSIRAYTIGNVNGDSYQDIAMVGDGWLAVLFGKASGWSKNVNVTSSSIDGASDGSRGFYVTMDATHGSFGQSVAIGNFNGDTNPGPGANTGKPYEDIAVGQYTLGGPEATYRGVVSLIMGRASWSATYTDNIINGTNGFRFQSWGWTGTLGSSDPTSRMAGLGKAVGLADLDGDGYAELAMSSHTDATYTTPQLYILVGVADPAASWGSSTLYSLETIHNLSSANHLWIKGNAGEEMGSKIVADDGNKRSLGVSHFGTGSGILEVYGQQGYSPYANSFGTGDYTINSHTYGVPFEIGSPIDELRHINLQDVTGDGIGDVMFSYQRGSDENLILCYLDCAEYNRNDVDYADWLGMWPDDPSFTQSSRYIANFIPMPNPDNSSGMLAFSQPAFDGAAGANSGRVYLDYLWYPVSGGLNVYNAVPGTGGTSEESY